MTTLRDEIRKLAEEAAQKLHSERALKTYALDDAPPIESAIHAGIKLVQRWTPVRAMTTNEEIAILREEIAGLRKAKEEAERDSERYRNIRDAGIPCLQGDDCGSCTGEELDTQIDDAIAHPEKYDV
jgi:hypothetical protein